MHLPHTVTVTTAGTRTDRYDNVVASWAPGDVTTKSIQGFMQPLVTNENSIGRDAVEYGYTIFTDEAIDAHARVTWSGRTYEVTGPSRPWATIYRTHHFETYLRVTEG